MIKNLLSIACLAAALFSCDKVEHKLEGKWQLRSVEENGATHKVDTVWYNFQTSLFQYQCYDAANDSYRGNYGYKTLKDDKTLELELVTYGTPVEKFLPYTDWNSAKRLFNIEKSSTTQLILSSEGKRYFFKKF